MFFYFLETCTLKPVCLSHIALHPSFIHRHHHHKHFKVTQIMLIIARTTGAQTIVMNGYSNTPLI